MNDKTELLKNFINESENIVFFGGAGVSTESGVPDFRSKNGLYNQHDVRFENYTPEYLLSHECLVNEPEVFFEFYRQKMDTRKIKPNAAHYYLAELEKSGKLKAVVTQNIDGLHQLAGSKNVYEIHGTTKRNYCVKCKKEYPSDYIFESQDSIPRSGCGGIIRCDVTLYGESLPEDAVENAISAIYDADMLIVGVTSLSVYPAASFIRYFHGKHLAVINLDSLNCLRKGRDDIEINLPIGKVFSELLE
jgi:NAD-dependent deacetylase